MGPGPTQLSKANEKMRAFVLAAFKPSEFKRAGEIVNAAKNELGLKDPMRAVDRALQHWRKAGRIVFVNGKGWRLADTRELE